MSTSTSTQNYTSHISFHIDICLLTTLHCCTDIFVGVVPDDDMGDQLVRIFGKESHAVRRYQRMMYWMPKFKFANPYYVPYVLPNDDIELAKLALNRMSVDLENTLTVYPVSYTHLTLPTTPYV